MSRTLEKLAADSNALYEYEIILRLGPEAYKKFDGCPFPLCYDTDDEIDSHRAKDRKIFYIEFNSRFEEADQKVLLEWFRELTVSAAKDTTQADSNAKAAKDSGEWSALMFPSSSSNLSKQQRTLWHKLAQDIHLQSQIEESNAFLMITFGDVPRPASPRLDAHDGTKAAGPEGSKKEEMLQLQLELHTKNIWSCCQEEGGSYMQYSQGQVKQILENLKATPMPPDLVALCEKRTMAVKLLRAIANKDEKLAIDLLENDKSLALMNIDLIDQTGYPLHHAASHGAHAVVALIIKDKTTIEQKDQHGKLALDLAVMYNNNGSHDSIIQLLKTAGVEDKAANHAVDDRGVADASNNGITWTTLKKPTEQPLRDAVAKKSTKFGDQDKSASAIPVDKTNQKDTTEPIVGSHTRGTGPEASVNKGETRTEKTEVQDLVKEVEDTAIQWCRLDEQTASVIEQLAKLLRLSARMVRQLAELQRALSSQSAKANRS